MWSRLQSPKPFKRIRQTSRFSNKVISAVAVFSLAYLSLVWIIGHRVGALTGNLIKYEWSDDQAVRTVRLSKPVHRFHSDHWFHIAEYYLSNNMVMNSASIRNLYHEPSDACHVIIVAPDDSRFLKRITKVTFFLLLLSFTNVNDVSVFLVGNKHSLSKESAHNRLHRALSYFSDAHIWVQYDGTRPISERFIMQSKNYHQQVIPSSAKNDLCTNHSSLNTENSPVSSGRDFCSNYSLINTGNSPVNSGKWFNSSRQADRMRHRISVLCSNNYESQGDDISRDHDISIKLRRAQPHILVSRKVDGSFLSLPAAIDRPLDALSGSNTSAHGRKYRIVLYERDSNRFFQDIEGILLLLSMQTDSWTQNDVGDDRVTWDIDVIYHSNDMNPCLLHVALKNADILLTTHGFQSTGAVCVILKCCSTSSIQFTHSHSICLSISPCLCRQQINSNKMYPLFFPTALLFMKRGAVLIEAFPYKYYKETYVRLSASYGIHHRWIQNVRPSSFSR
jgi:hypothetical protein